MTQTTIRSPSQPVKSPNHSSKAFDSPSRQLQLELEHALNRMSLHENERQKVHAFNRRSLQLQLDAREFEQARLHRAELDFASAKHDNVRQHAQEVLEAHIKAEEEKRRQEYEQELRRKEEETRKKFEEQRRRREVLELREREEREKVEAARRAAEEKAKSEAEEKQRREREATAQREKKEEEARKLAEDESARKQKEQADIEVKNQKAEQQSRRVVPPSTVTTKTADSNQENQHKSYLVIHQKLKGFRKEFWDTAKKDPTLKPVVGDMRRAMRTSVGQLTDDKIGNRKATERVKGAINKALRELPSPPVTLNEYLPPHLSLNDDNATKIPSLVLYLISVFSKAIINSFVGECAVNTKAAEPIGTLAAQIFSMPELQYHRNPSLVHSNVNDDKPETISLITILMCKFHAVAPVLFGISGSEETKAGRLRLGWRLDYVQAGESQKTFAPEQRHYDRMIGLGAGYASIALRNFSKAKLINPYPPIHFWESFAGIINTPSQHIQSTHLIILKSMLEVGVDRFVLFYGSTAIAAIREALVELPRRLNPELAQKPAAKGIVLLVETFKKERNFSLM